MKKNVNSAVKQSFSVLGISLAASLLLSPAAQAEWSFGIGTGLSRTSINGTQGFNSVIGVPVKYKVDLTPSDFADLTKSAFGFGGYATDGTWLIQYSLASLELEDESATTVGTNTLATKINFTTRGGEVTAGYPVYKSPSLVALVDVGVRYTKHSFDNTTTVTGTINTQLKNKFSNDWTDAVVGTTLNVPLAPQWLWSTRLNAGFGGSDHTYLASTGVTWRFLKSWSAGALAKYVEVQYEDGNEGASDWYLYDADEKSVALNVLYNW